MRHPLSLIAISLSLLTAMMISAAAAELERVELEPMSFDPAELTVAGPKETKLYEVSDLEKLGTYRLETVTPWRSEPAVFEGVLLSDVLAENGLGDVGAILVTAENDYTVVIPREVWTDRPLMIATRVDGKPHSRRARGPLQFVFPMSAEPRLGDQSFEANWVWMASKIEPAE